jgi:hypothetical protein
MLSLVNSRYYLTGTIEGGVCHNHDMRMLIFIAVALLAGTSVQAQGVSQVLLSGDPMSEELRDSFRKVVLVPGDSPVDEEIGGSYEKETHGFYGGMAAGSGATTVHTQAGPVAVSIPIPVLQLPGMLAGGIAGATQKEIQDFRDALADDLVKASSQQLINEKIASDVYYEIRTAPNLEPQVFARETPVPEDTDAILYVKIRDLIIQVEGNDAIITATVIATMHRRDDESDVYETTVQYQDRDTLRNWTENDNAVWRDFANYARHYVGREVAAQVFHSAEVAHTLLPAKSSDVSVSRKDRWDGSSKKLSPTLAWEMNLTGDETDPAWAAGIDESNVFYDVEIYDLHRPVYSAKNVRGGEHTVTAQLDSCETYRWSVRPAYHVGGAIKYGPWMRSGTSGNGNIGQKASEASAYIYDFAKLKIKCGAK